jgi:hypothetical protein
MVTASRSRPRVSTATFYTRRAAVALRTWLAPALAVVAVVVLALLSAAEVLDGTLALAGAIVATLLLLVYIGERPLVVNERPVRARALGAAVATVWLAACYLPYHFRLFRGTPLVAGAQVSAAGRGLPLRIPAAGHAAVDLVLEGHLAPPTGGGAAPPVEFRLTVEGTGGEPRVLPGRFEDSLRTRRMGRRGSAVVHQTHTAEVQVLPNPERGDLTVTKLELEPANAQPITISAFPHPLPGPLVLGLAAALLLGAAVAFDRLGPVPETDGALTLSTGAVLGTAVIFWTSNTVRPGFQTLIGSAIFGGTLGFGASALVWWIAKRLIVQPTR